MRCLFCKQDSSISKSVEHIIPESLGNTTYVLPRGVVCDKCNNYFSRKIEQPFLDSVEMKAMRFREAIPNKRGRVPPVEGILNDKIPVRVYNPIPGIPMFSPDKELIIAIESDYMDISKIDSVGKIITPAFIDEMIPKTNYVISRFIAKIAFESLALKLSKVTGGIDYLIDEPQFDSIRNHIRYGDKTVWPCNIRRIYAMDKTWVDREGYTYQLMNESDFLLIPANEEVDLQNDNPVMVYPFFILALFGLEFAIYIGTPNEEGLEIYRDWLEKHGGASPLYVGNNEKLL